MNHLDIAQAASKGRRCRKWQRSYLNPSSGPDRGIDWCVQFPNHVSLRPPDILDLAKYPSSYLGPRAGAEHPR